MSLPGCDRRRGFPRGNAIIFVLVLLLVNFAIERQSIARDKMVQFHIPTADEAPLMRQLVLEDEYLREDVAHGYLGIPDQLLVAFADLDHGAEKAVIMIIDSGAACGTAGCYLLVWLQHGRSWNLVMHTGGAGQNPRTKISNVTILDRTHFGFHDIRLGREVWKWWGDQYSVSPPRKPATIK